MNWLKRLGTQKPTTQAQGFLSPEPPGTVSGGFESSYRNPSYSQDFSQMKSSLQALDGDEEDDTMAQSALRKPVSMEHSAEEDEDEPPTTVVKASSPAQIHVSKVPPPPSVAHAKQHTGPNPEPDDEPVTKILKPSKKLLQDQAHLVVKNGRLSGTIYTFTAEHAVTIGRSRDCEIMIEWERGIGRHHAKIRKEDADFVLYDLASTNGTYVNGEEILKVKLQDGDEVLFGENPLIFKWTKVEARHRV